MSSCSIIKGTGGYFMSNNKRTIIIKVIINKRAVRIQSIKRVAVRTVIIAITKNGSSMRDPFYLLPLVIVSHSK